MELTPLHRHLWHRAFWALSFAALLLTVAEYVELATFCKLVQTDAPTQLILLAAYGVGLFLWGCRVSFLVQRHRRNQVCLISMLIFAAIACLLGYFKPTNPTLLILLRLASGITYGLSQMIICSTLAIDICQNTYRTEANLMIAWFRRFGAVLGLIAITLLLQWNTQLVQWVGIDIHPLYVAGALSLLAVALICTIELPFKSPEDDYPAVSFDRFLLPKEWLQFFVVAAITAIMSIYCQNLLRLDALAALFCGILTAYIFEHVIGWHISHRLYPFCGFLLLAGGMLMNRCAVFGSSKMLYDISFLAIGMIGMGFAMMLSSILLQMTSRSDHCQRGTAQSTFFLATETGIIAGLMLPNIFALYALLAFVFAYLFIHLLYKKLQ